MLKNRIIIALLAAFAAQNGNAAEPFVVRDIRIEGIQRTEAGTVFSYLPVKVGDTLDADKVTAAIKALYATGFFKDVRLEEQDGVLIVTVEERPSISNVTFTGAKEFSDEDLKNGLKQVGLTEGRVLDRALLEKAQQELERQYFNRGMYAVQIKSTVTPLDRNRVSVQFDVVEGSIAKIRQINIVGNKVFKEKELLGEFSSTTPNWLSWYTKDDQYSKAKLAGDIEKLRSFYLNRGYIEFNVDSTQVSISPDKEDIYITVNVTEGPLYTVSEVKLAGQTLVPEEELNKLIMLKPGDVFARDKLTESTKKIADLLGNEGYAFANVNAIPELDKDKYQVAFTLFVDPGRRVYVDRVNITGNTKTRDEVVRREIRQMEGGWYDASKINRSRERLNVLGYFNEVNVETPPVPGTTDQVDVNFSVTEKSTGSILVGAGFSSSEGLILSGSVSQSNVFGTGNHLSLQINTSKVNTVYSLSYTDPYFTLDGVSLGGDIYLRQLNGDELNGVAGYQTRTKGIGTHLGIPINEKDTITLGLTYEQTDLTLTQSSSLEYLLFALLYGNSYDTLRLDTSWSRNTVDSVLYPTRGANQRLAAEIGIPPAELRYYKVSYQYQQYLPLYKDFTLMLNGEIGYGDGLDGNPLPFFKNFYAGGVSSVRGFKTATLGPRDLRGDAVGGDKRLVGNAELYFPLPGMKNDHSLRFSAFIDGGTVYGPNQDYNFNDLSFSAGLGLMWVSPLGPLKFSLAEPLVKQPGADTEMFQFTMGNVF